MPLKKVNIALSICFPTLTSVTNYLHMVRYELLLHKEPKAIYLSNVVMSYFLAKKDGLLTHFLIYCQTFLINPFWLRRDWRHWKRPKDSNRLPNRSVHKLMDTFKIFSCELGIKLLFFSTYYVIVRPTKIMKRAKKKWVHL